MQICAAVFFVCVCVPVWSILSGGLTADPVQMGGVGGGVEGSCVLLEHLPLFLLSQAMVRRGERTGGRK